MNCVFFVYMLNICKKTNLKLVILSIGGAWFDLYFFLWHDKKRRDVCQMCLSDSLTSFKPLYSNTVFNNQAPTPLIKYFWVNGLRSISFKYKKIINICIMTEIKNVCQTHKRPTDLILFTAIKLFTAINDCRKQECEGDNMRKHR